MSNKYKSKTGNYLLKIIYYHKIEIQIGKEDIKKNTHLSISISSLIEYPGNVVSLFFLKPVSLLILDFPYMLLSLKKKGSLIKVR